MLDFLREIRYDSAYTFIYSKRSGTPAATMENQVEESVKKERLNALMAVQNEISLAINEKLLGKTLEIMVEGPSKNEPSVWMGRTRTNKIVLFAPRARSRATSSTSASRTRRPGSSRANAYHKE